jgi:hypothetical protein
MSTTTFDIDLVGHHCTGSITAVGKTVEGIAEWLGLDETHEVTGELSGYFATVIDLFTGVEVPTDHLKDAVQLLAELVDQLTPLTRETVRGWDQ